MIALHNRGETYTTVVFWSLTSPFINQVVTNHALFLIVGFVSLLIHPYAKIQKKKRRKKIFNQLIEG